MPNRYTNILVGPHQVAIDITNNCNLRCLIAIIVAAKTCFKARIIR